jgi:hypothetical protein
MQASVTSPEGCVDGMTASTYRLPHFPASQSAAYSFPCSCFCSSPSWVTPHVVEKCCRVEMNEGDLNREGGRVLQLREGQKRDDANVEMSHTRW